MVGGMNSTAHRELGLLGSLFVRPDLLEAVREIVPSAEMFAPGARRRIYAALLELADGGLEPDARGLLGHFIDRDRLDAEVQAVVRELGNFVPCGTNAAAFARRVRDASYNRQVQQRQNAIDELRAGGARVDAIARAVAELRDLVEQWMAADADRGPATSDEAIDAYLARLRRGDEELMRLGIDDLDRALSGGVGYGEFVAFAAPSNHCKSSLALHVVHAAAARDMPCLVISAEMTAELLGKRTLQTMLDGLSEHDYRANLEALESAASDYRQGRRSWYVDDRSKTLDEVLSSIDAGVKQHGVRFVAIDYLQMIECRATNKFEAVSRVSSALRDKAKEHGIVLLALCQMNNHIMKRPKFQPKVSDIEYGPQIFKDADVVIFGVWPHRVDELQPADKYDFYIAKSRNRAILRSVLQVRWDAARQIFYGLTRGERNALANDFAGAFD